MNKDLASKLIKIANSLDDIGYFNEANSLTKIAKKVVLSYSTFPSGDYKKDIDNYKEIIIKFQELQDSGNYFEKSNVAQSATIFLNMIKETYPEQQKEVFLLQAKNIRNEIYGKLDGGVLNNKLYNLLVSKDMIDSNQNPNYKLVDFRDMWMREIYPEFDTENRNIANWLTNKFNLYKTKILTLYK